MVDIQTISIAIASASVVAGVIYYALQLRHQVKQRQTELITRFSSDYLTRRQFLDAVVNIYETEFKDYSDFVKRYGKIISKNEIPMSFIIIGNFFEQIGILFKNRLIDASLVSQLFSVSVMWEKMKPLVEGMRKESHEPELFGGFEYLYNELKKREQQQAKAK
jgi:hypothetical protein